MAIDLKVLTLKHLMTSTIDVIPEDEYFNEPLVNSIPSITFCDEADIIVSTSKNIEYVQGKILS